MQKLILLNGAAGIGKSTIAQCYIDQHPLALSLEGDSIISMIGQWYENEPTARKSVFEIMNIIMSHYLGTGNDVLLPYLLVNSDDAEAFKNIASKSGVSFVEVTLQSTKKDAIDRLLERGTWGEAGAPPVTREDIPVIEDLYERMEIALKKRKSMKYVTSIRNDIDKTYKLFLAAIG